MPALYGLLVVVSLLVAGWPGDAAASHTEFDYAIERVELDGNIHGPADGTVDVVDGFDDGVMGPLFAPLWGTSLETGGALHVRDPGFHYEANGQPFVLDQSEVMSSVLIDEGAGDLTARVVWRPTAIGVNHYIHASWFASGADGIGTIGLAVTNYDSELAALFTPPQQSGLMMQAHAVRVHGAFDLETVVLDPRPVTYDSASGAIVLQLHYDDSARTLGVSYSLDGGANFAAPFEPLPVVGFTGNGSGTARLIVGADPYEVAPPPPPPPPCQFVFDKVMVNRLGAPLGNETVQIAGHGPAGTPVVDAASEGLGVAIVDQGNGGALVVDLLGPNKIPPGPIGSGCDPRDGWVQRGNRSTYRNYSGAFPPACIPGSARGVRSARVKPYRNWAGYMSVAVALKNVSIASIVGTIDGSTVTRGDGTGPVGQCYTFVELNAVPCVPKTAARVKCAF